MKVIRLKYGTSMYEINKMVSESLNENIEVYFDPYVSAETIVLKCTIVLKEKKNSGFAYSYLMEKIDNYKLKFEAYKEAVEMIGVLLEVSPEDTNQDTTPPPISTEPTKKINLKTYITTLKLKDEYTKELIDVTKKLKLSKKEMDEAFNDTFESNKGLAGLTNKNVDEYIDVLYDLYSGDDECGI